MIRIPSSHQISGQALLISVLLFIVIAIAVPVMIFVNQTITQHATRSHRKMKSRTLAEEGIAVAKKQLSRPNGWPFPGGNSPAGIPPDVTIYSVQGSSFALSYVAGPQGTVLKDYQVGVTVAPVDEAGAPVQGSGLFAKMSAKTLALTLPTGKSIPVALELVTPPVYGPNGRLVVDYGPILLRSALPWTLDGAHEQRQRPRIYSAGCISPRIDAAACATPPDSTTDNKEYWAFSSPGFGQVLDMAEYQALATASLCPTPLGGCAACAGNCIPVPAVPGPGNSCYYPNVGDCTAELDAYTIVNPNTVIYINGNVKIKDVSINVTNGAFIVTCQAAGCAGANGNVTLEPPDPLNPAPNYPFSGFALTNHPDLPQFADLDDPFDTCVGACNTGKIDRHIDMRGFFYVEKNVTVTGHNNPGRAHQFTLLGASRIDGLLTIAENASFAVYYHESVNRNVRVQNSNFEVQVDSTSWLK